MSTACIEMFSKIILNVYFFSLISDIQVFYYKYKNNLKL